MALGPQMVSTSPSANREGGTSAVPNTLLIIWATARKSSRVSLGWTRNVRLSSRSRRAFDNGLPGLVPGRRIATS